MTEKTNYNILFITTDQERFFSEYPEETDYKARKLLEELGTSFEKHYVCSNMSTSSRSVIYTGTHITDTKMIDNTDFPWQGALDESIATIGDRLRDAGYYTAYKGKWHMGDSSILVEVDNSLTSLEEYGFSDWGGIDYIGSMHEGYKMDPVIASEAVEWLESTGKKLNEEKKPFFLAVNMVNPHDIMEFNTAGYQSMFLELGGAPDDPVYSRSYDAPVSSSWNTDLTSEDIPQAVRNFHQRWTMQAGDLKTEEEWKEYQDYYLNCIQDNDNSLMKILTCLRENGMMENTIIVFTSDHGELLGSHALKGKGGMMYDNNIHVPLIIVHPEHSGGKKVSAVTSHMDLAPTFTDISGAADEKFGPLSGSSLIGLIDGSEESVRDGALFCYEMISLGAVDVSGDASGRPVFTLNPEERGMVRGIVTEDYKYVRYFSPVNFNTPETLEDILNNNDIQLFDTKNDPEELVNLASDPQKNADLILSLNEKLNRLIEKEIGTDDGQEVEFCLRILQNTERE